MIPDILEPKTSALIDDLTPVPVVAHNLISVGDHMDVYECMEEYGLLDHEQAHDLWIALTEGDAHVGMFVMPDGRVVYDCWEPEYVNSMATALDALRYLCVDMGTYDRADPRQGLQSALLWQSALLGIDLEGNITAVFAPDSRTFYYTYPELHPVKAYVALKTALVQSATTNEEERT